MKVVVDARGIRDGMTGVGYYTSHLVSELGAARPNDQFVFLTLRKEGPALRPALRAPNAEWLEVDADYESHPAGDWWEHRALPLLLDRIGADVFHGPAFMVPYSLAPLFLPFSRGPARAGLVVTIHDLSVFTMPQGYPLLFRLYLRQVMRRSVRAAHRVICPSAFTRDEALRLWPNLPPGKFDVIPHAQAPCFQAAPPEDPGRLRARYNLPDKFLLMVGTFESRKNPTFFRSLYDRLLPRLGGRTTPLVWVGSVGFGGREALSNLRPLRDKGLFRLMGALPLEDLPGLYHTATALVYPSLNEGFGLPLLEAMACGLPVLAADTTCLPEVVGQGGRILPLERPEDWAGAIQALLDDPGEMAQARDRALRWAAKFSWKRTARRTAEVYEEAAP